MLSVTGLIVKRHQASLFWIAVPLHGLLFLPFGYAVSCWPRGDDGPGMAWGLLIGGGSFIATLLTAILLILRVAPLLSRRTTAKETEENRGSTLMRRIVMEHLHGGMENLTLPDRSRIIHPVRGVV